MIHRKPATLCRPVASVLAVALLALAGLNAPSFGQQTQAQRQEAARLQRQLEALQRQISDLRQAREGADTGEAGTLPADWVQEVQWRSIGPASMGGRITDIAVVESNPSTFYIATASGGLLKTVNNGTSFVHQFDQEATVSIGDAAVSASNPDIVWVGTGEANPRNSVSYGDGVYKSTDGGDSWTHMGLRETFQIGKVVIHPSNPDIVYVGAMGRLYGPSQERGLYKTINGGRSWDKVLFVNDKTGVIDIQMHPHDPGTLLVATYERQRDGFDTGEPAISHGPGSGLWKTTDSGRSFTRIREGLPEEEMGRIGISYYRKNPNVVYLTTGRQRRPNDDNGVYKSTDGGDSWTKISDNAPRPMYFSQIRVDPSDSERVYMTGVSYYRSEDGGKTFTSGRGVHSDQHALWIDPNDGKHMIIGTDGGVYVTYDRMETWDHLNHVAIGQFYHVAVDSSPLYSVYGGLQDNGSWGAPNRGLSGRGPVNQDWLSISGADGFVCRVDPNNRFLVYSESQSGGIRRRDLQTGESANFKPRAPEGGRYRWNWRTPFILSAHNSKIYYTAANYVFRSLDRGNNLRIISPELSLTERGSATAVAESPLNPDVLYAGTDDGALWVTSDGGANWQEISSHLRLPKPMWVTSIEASRYDEGRAYVSFDGHRSDNDAPHVYMTEDFGETWKNLAANLPSFGSTRVLREDIVNQNLLYVGTEFAVFASIDRGESWTKLNNNLPTVAVHEVAQHPTSGEIIVATHGRSIWIADVTTLRQTSTQVLEEAAHLFKPNNVTQWRSEPRRGRTNREFAGTNPAPVAHIFYSLADGAREVSLRIVGPAGTVRELEGPTGRGLNRIDWDLRPTPPPPPPESQQRGGRGGRGRGGRGRARQAPPVSPGQFRLVLSVDGQEFVQTISVLADPRG